MLTEILEGPEAIRAILGFARQLYDYQEFNYVGRYGEDGFVEDYTSVVRGEHRRADLLTIPRQRFPRGKIDVILCCRLGPFLNVSCAGVGNILLLIGIA
ncbi:MAG: hypothetical protein ACJ74U_14845 [Jatrophihabitantaceae bacterium]